jgi:hypothetical protein
MEMKERIFPLLPDALPELVPYEAFDESHAREAVQLAQEIYQFFKGCVRINDLFNGR